MLARLSLKNKLLITVLPLPILVVTIADSAENASRSAGQVRRRSQDLQSLAGRLNTLVSRFQL